MKHKALVSAFVVSTMPMHSFARDATDGLARDARENAVDRSSARLADDQTLTFFGVRPEDSQPKPKHAYRVGVAYDSNQTGTNTSNLLYELQYTTAHPEKSIDYWTFKLSSDGLMRIAAPGQQTQSGVSDQKISVTRPMGSAEVLGSVTYKLPTHGDVGSTSSSLGGKLSFSQTLGNWTGIVIGGLTRSANKATGVSRYSMLGYVELDYDLGEKKTLVFNLSRVRKGGTVGSTDLAVEYDFPLKAIASSAFLSVTRGVTRTANHTAVEIDISHKF